MDSFSEYGDGNDFDEYLLEFAVVLGTMID